MTPANIEHLSEEYARRGYAVVPGVLTAEQLDVSRAEADRLLAKMTEKLERYRRRVQLEADYLADSDRTGMDHVIRKIEPLIDLSDHFNNLARLPAIQDVAARALGEPVLLFEDKLNLKLPRGSSYPWHQDWSCCWRSFPDELVTCFIYLDDADETNGCLQVVPGSHLGKNLYPFMGHDHFEVTPDSFDPSTILPLPLNAGDMILFDSYLLHYSDINRGSEPRRTIIYTYSPARLGDINGGRFAAAALT